MGLSRFHHRFNPTVVHISCCLLYTSNIILPGNFTFVPMPKLKDVSLDKTITDEKYKKQLKKLQEELSELHNKIYRRRVPVVVCYEGWDAAGKGGNIRRVAAALDPRGYKVVPIAGPTAPELAHHYLLSLIHI